jgi:hybrid polyketide synthase/nonribosomal peptide synthetase ACE1
MFGCRSLDALPVLQDAGKFARKLKVNTAYHSRHMLTCADEYREALKRCNIRIRPGNGLVWVSSVLPGQSMTASFLEDLGPNYWVDNMTNPVYFVPAVAKAAENNAAFDLVMKIGPHPALEAPCLETIKLNTGQAPHTLACCGASRMM